MSNLTKALLILAALALGGFMLWKMNYPTHAWNQKLTVTVSTPRGEVSGSSVVAVSWNKAFFRGEGALYRLTLRGDATAVDLGGGQFLFALLAYEDSQEPQSTGMIPLKLLRQEIPARAPYDDNYWETDTFKRVQAARGRGPITLPQKLYPRFLRLRDIKDPTTAELVDPNDLAKSFGPGVRLVRVTIEITDDAVTRGIRKILPWVSRNAEWFRLNAPKVPPLGPPHLIDIDTL
jgi:hypothetical protein